MILAGNDGFNRIFCLLMVALCFAKDNRIYLSRVSSEGLCSKYDICQDESFLSLSCFTDGDMAIVIPLLAWGLKPNNNPMKNALAL